MIFRALILPLLALPVIAQVTRLAPAQVAEVAPPDGVEQDKAPEAAEVLAGQVANQARPKPLTPEQQRSRLLANLQIDRTTSGILKARLAAQGERKTGPVPPQPRPAPAEESPAQKKQREDQARLATYRYDFQAFSRDLVLGHWEEVKKYLAALPDNDATTAFRRIVSQFGAPVTVTPRPELTALGARPHPQEQYLRPAEFLALTDAAKNPPAPDLFPELARLMAGDRKPPRDFFAALARGTRYFGTRDPEARLRTARLLVEASHLEEALPFLPDRAEARKTKNFPALNLLARYHAESHSARRGPDHLQSAWELSLGLIGSPEAPAPERTEALYRALALVPELDGTTGSQWLVETFAEGSAEGFEILATVGTLASQVREVRSPDFRLEQLKLQAAAVAALTGLPDIDLTPYREILTLFVRNWNAEAERSERLDTSSSLRPQAQVDAFGNLYYARNQPTPGPSSSRSTPPVPSGDLLRIRPGDDWLALIDPPVRTENLTLAAKLLLKVKEEERAFPILEELAATRPEETITLVRELIRVWAENNNPNQESQYRSRYSYFYGYNQRAETIPLTRSKQERNLKLLARIVAEVRSLDLDASFDEDFAEAFIQAHSKAEVWRLEALTTVFGDLAALDPDTIASLVRRMRGNLTGLWPDPKLQQQAKTNRKDKELEAQIFEGYRAAKNLCLDTLDLHPDHWAVQIQLAALKFEESNYQSSLQAHPEHSTIKAFALEDLANAAQAYADTLPPEEEQEESVEPFTSWFYAALGSPDLAALKTEHQPVPAEFPKIKQALASLPEPARSRHRDDFARTLNARLANVPADLKYRFLEAALDITGPHERIAEAARIFQYYQDLVTEIELEVRLDGPDQVDPNEPFGLFVNLRHTKEIERESGGFQRYLINQSNSPYSYNYGRPTEDYRDKFEKGARSALEEHFDIVSLTFHNSKVASRTDAQPGWTRTPYAYFLLKPKGPQVDVIPPLKIDLDFLDTSGYVVLPIASAAIPIDASPTAKTPPRPYRDLSLTMILDQREAEEEGTLALEIRATAHGLVPPLEELISLPIKGFTIASTDDRMLQIDELDARTDDGAPLSTHEWRLLLEAEGGTLPANFTFPAVLADLSTKKDQGLARQKYDDVDLVTVEATTPLADGTTSRSPLFWLIPLAVVAGLVLFLLFRPRKKEEAPAVGPSLPNTLTPVSLLAFLEKVRDRPQLPEDTRSKLQQTIRSLRDRAFGPSTDVPDSGELREIAENSLRALAKSNPRTG